jgi:hypothetical protein
MMNVAHNDFLCVVNLTKICTAIFIGFNKSSSQNFCCNEWFSLISGFALITRYSLFFISPLATQLSCVLTQLKECLEKNIQTECETQTDRKRHIHFQPIHYIHRRYCLNVPNMGIGGGQMLLTISGSKSISSITLLNYHTGRLFLLSYIHFKIYCILIGLGE